MPAKAEAASDDCPLCAGARGTAAVRRSSTGFATSCGSTGCHQALTLLPPTLSEVGLDKALAQRGRILARLDEKKFETTVADARDAVQRAVRNVIRAAQHEQERADSYEIRILYGCDLTDLDALVASGYRSRRYCRRRAMVVSKLIPARARTVPQSATMTRRFSIGS